MYGLSWGSKFIIFYVDFLHLSNLDIHKGYILNLQIVLFLWLSL